MVGRDQRDAAPGREDGFTVIEMTVAMSILAGVFLAMAFALYGGLNAFGAARQRSAFLEVANAEMEALRAVAYDNVGVLTGDFTTGPTGNYPGGQFDGRDAVVVATGAPAAVSTVTTSPIKGIVLPYTVRRWVTWSDTTGGIAHQFKRLHIRVEWTENQRVNRKLSLTSVLYPGNLGPPVAANNPPTAVITPPSPATGTVGDVFSFDGSGSSDPDATDTLIYTWNFGDGTTASGPTVSHAYTTPGGKTVVLVVTDSRGAGSTPASTNVSVTDPSGNNPPTASFTHNPTTGTAPLTVNFDASPSSDAEGDDSTLTFQWNWGDSTPTETGVAKGHIFNTAGTFTVTLTVTDQGGLTATSTSAIVVVPLNCDVTAGSLKNPGSNATSDDVLLGSNDKPVSDQFVFTATTNVACTTVTANVPIDGGSTSQNLTLVSQSGNVKTWSGSLTVASKMNTGNQTASMAATDGIAPDTFSYAVNVHKT